MSRTTVPLAVGAVAFPTVVFGLACSGGQGAPDPSIPVEPAFDADAFTRFESSQYSYCDALVLAAYWKETTSDAKMRIGRKIGWGDHAIVVSELAQAQSQAHARNEVPCEFWDTGFTWDDAVRLAAAWGTDEYSAKTKVAKMCSWGQRTEVMEALARSPVAEGGEGFDVDMDSTYVAAWSGSGYTFCDAALVGHHWGTQAWDGKVSIGYKLTNGWGHLIPPLLEESRTHARTDGFTCTFYDEGYTYEDAEALARLWSVPLDEAKARMNDKLFMGGGAILKDEVARARG